MTVSGNEHRQIVDLLLGYLKANTKGQPFPPPEKVLEAVFEIAPRAEQEDYDRASEDAKGIWNEMLEVERSELAEMERVATLFEGMPEGTPLGTCARVKARQGNQIAMDFCRREGISYA